YWAPGQHAVQTGSRITPAVSAVPGVSQFCVASRELASAFAPARAQQRHGLSQEMAAVYAGEGGQVDRPCLELERSAALSGATMAAAPSAVSGSGAGRWWDDVGQVCPRGVHAG